MVLTATKVSGSSVGVFNTFLFGKDASPHIVANEPRGVRSDEWEVNTPFTVAQVESGMPRINKNIGNGQDMSIVLDVPYKEWSTVFKPQNWVFFVLPLEYAFAFKWWFLACALMLACYVFCLKLLPQKYLLASLISVSLFLSPFVQWWYQTATIMPLAWGFLLLYITLKIFEKTQTKRNILLLTALLAYCLACFAFVLYVPFLVPVALVIAAFLVGHICNLYRVRANQPYIRQRLLYCIAAAVGVILVLFVFLQTRSSAVEAISNTVYPGHRIEKSGGFNLLQLGSGYFNGQLQNLQKALHAPGGLNQSEAASFIFLLPLTVPLLLYVLFKKQTKPNLKDWRIIALLTIFGLFLVRMFVPFSEIFFNIVQLNRIPHNRLLIGIGLLNILLLILLFEHLLKTKTYFTKLQTGIFTAIAFLCPLIVGFAIKLQTTGYLESSAKILLISLFVGVIAWLILRKRLSAAMAVLVALSLYATIHVNPLYKGLSPLTNSSLSKNLKSIGDKNGKWVVSEDVIFENVTHANNLHSLSGVYAYPQLELWKPLEKTTSDEDIYNRYAHVFFSTQLVGKDQSSVGAYLNPPALDAFQINADPCGEYFKQMNVRYILTSQEKGFSCLRQIRTIEYPALTFRVYEIDR